MIRKITRHSPTLALAALLAAASLHATARADDSYPSRPVRIISPYAAGGTPASWRGRSPNN